MPVGSGHLTGRIEWVDTAEVTGAGRLVVQWPAGIMDITDIMCGICSGVVDVTVVR